MNKVILKGNVGTDPAIKYFENGGQTATFTLATTERGYTTKDGRQIPETTDWHQIVVKQSGLAEICEKFIKKGSPLLVVGKIKYRSFDGQDGQKRYITEIIVDELELMGGKKPEQSAQSEAPVETHKDPDRPF